MKHHTQGARARSSAGSNSLRVSGGGEATSSEFHEEPPFIRPAGDTLGPRWRRGKDGRRGADRKAALFPWQRLGRSPEQRPQSSSGPVLAMTAPPSDCAGEACGDGNNTEDDPALNVAPAVPLTSSTRPPSVCTQRTERHDADALHEVEGARPKLLAHEERRVLVSPPAGSCGGGLGESHRRHPVIPAGAAAEGAQRVVNESPGSLGAAPSPLYILVAPSSAAADIGASELHSEASPLAHAQVRVGEEVQRQETGQRGTLGGFLGNRRVGFLTSPPPQTSCDRLPMHASEVTSLLDAAPTSPAARRHQTRCSLRTPPVTEHPPSIGSPWRPRSAVIGSWRSLSSHCKRAGLQTPEVPLLLKQRGGDAF
ncbi:uncharacterized protein Tco025E_08228 [Trypanosoma conorhini]|uniref:Uncharacterized protein n=1 Tax=Trypanosoma conorhini TaxID=83891 RepID=A0A3R7NAG7_9TRYP|nr:uncharacterized protein Tco025E_08228 [Trypanosoma conorhini]RNF03226.1 hypothetical protein Tco025E_08228 [Trypanosoma conorhini]